MKIDSIDATEYLKLADDLLPVILPIEQAPIWSNFESKLPGREPLGFFKFSIGGKLIGIFSATLFIQKARNWVWLKHGPIFAHQPNSEIVQSFCSSLKEYFTRTQNIKITFIRLSLPNKIASVKTPFEHTMYDQTVIVDLLKPEDELFLSFSQSVRQAVKKARKLGVSVRRSPLKMLAKNFSKNHSPILTETGKRGGFSAHPRSYYTTLLTTLNPAAKLYEASYKGKIVAWAIITEFRGKALYYYSASNDQARESEAQYLLQWEIIKELQKRGLKQYDLMGIAGRSYPALKM